MTHVIAILEDSARERDYFVEIIASAEDLSLGGVASTLGEAAVLVEPKPDLVLTDLGLPDVSGLTLSKPVFFSS
jgi:DNA-binding NarL/FixJ family response regulator